LLMLSRGCYVTFGNTSLFLYRRILSRNSVSAVAAIALCYQQLSLYSYML